MSYDIEYKAGDVDEIGAILSENGTPVNLTGLGVSFVMKNESGRVVVPCTLGGTVNNAVVPATGGGVTMHFSEASTATAGLYNGEFVVSWNATESIRFPSGNVHMTVMIWEAL